MDSSNIKNLINYAYEYLDLHKDDELYDNYFSKHSSDRKYIPHITIGQTFNTNDNQIKQIKNMKDEFEYLIPLEILYPYIFLNGYTRLYDINVPIE